MKKNQRGSALIEFALIMPIFVVILFGTIEYSILFYNKAVITNASREGARYGIVLRTPTYVTTNQVVTQTKTYCQNNLISFNTAQVAVTATASINPPVSGALLTVSVSYPYTYLIMGSILNTGTQITLTSTTVMAYE